MERAAPCHAHHRVPGDRGRQEQEAEEIAMPRHLNEQSAFVTHRKTPPLGDLIEPLLKSLSEPGRSRLERRGVAGLEDDFDVGTAGAEAWIRAYTDVRVDL